MNDPQLKDIHNTLLEIQKALREQHDAINIVSWTVLILAIFVIGDILFVSWAKLW